MRIILKFSLSLLLFLITAPPAFSQNTRERVQNDYIIKTNNDSIGNITITSYPEKLGLIVNSYNKKLMPRYEDHRINYTNSKGKEEFEFYSDVKSFSSQGTKFRTWHSREIPYNEGRIEFEKIIDMEGKTKDELYILVRSWMIGRFKLTADAIQRVLIENEAIGSLAINNISDGLISVTPPNSPTFSNWINFNLTIRVKDDKCKITLSNFIYHYEKGRIFNDKFKETNNINVENFVKDWRSEKGVIMSHWYQGLMMMFYCAEDKIIPDFEKSMIAKEKDDDDW